MKDYEVVGYLMLNTPAISSITTNIYHGLSPKGLDYPVITYFQMSGGGKNFGLSSKIFSITVRAVEAADARNLADEIINLFGGSAGTGIYGTIDTFTVSESQVVRDNGLIPEPEAGCYMVSIDVRLVFASDQSV